MLNLLREVGQLGQRLDVEEKQQQERIAYVSNLRATYRRPKLKLHVAFVENWQARV